MKNRTVLVRIALSSLVLGVTMVGCSSAHFGGVANASSRVDLKNSAARAEKALAAKDFTKAIAAAEGAVSVSPRDASLRTLLGRAYLGAGRLLSAETTFSDALTLDPGQARAALSLALVQTALGKTAKARDTIATYEAILPAADRGLALALAGDAPGAVSLLEATIRASAGDAKTRQNLALSYALAGRWSDARVMAAYDLPPADADARIIAWSQFVRPKSASDQVAALLGVSPVIDAGQPTMLALAPEASPVALAQAEPAPAPVAAPVPAPVVVVAKAEAPAVIAAVAEPAPAPVPVAVAAAEPAPVISEQRVAAFGGVTFAPRSEVVQALPASYAKDYQPQTRETLFAPQRVAAAQVATRVTRPSVQRAAWSAPASQGRFVVQLGAFSSPARLEAGWARAVRRLGALSDFTPSSATYVHATTYYRLSVGGFDTRAAAVQLCERVQSAGGNCFVRATAGDAPTQWAQRKGGTQIASR